MLWDGDRGLRQKSRWEDKASAHQEENSYTDGGAGGSGGIDYFRAIAEKELWGHATVWQKNPDTASQRKEKQRDTHCIIPSGSAPTVMRSGPQSPLGGANWEGAGGHFWGWKLSMA